MRHGEDALDFIRQEGDVERLITYLPVIVGDRAVAALEISESLRRHRAEVREELWGIALRTGLSAVLSAGAIGLLGFLMIGRPMRRLVEKARRMGNGDLSGPLAVTSRDEIGELAAELNETCDRLAAAHAKLAEETKARIAAIEQLRHADRLTTVGTLASGIAHELGTPLNVVAGRARMITAGELAGEAVSESARIIAEQAERMTKIIRQLLDFARRRPPERARQRLAHIVGKTVALLEPIARKRHVSLAGPDEEPVVEVLVDAVQLQQALTNLIVNGIQAMTAGGRLDVKVGRRLGTPPADVGGAERVHAYVEVADQGAGIPPDQIGRVFEPFFTTKDVGEGTGLGLSVAYGIIRDHGGWISVESEVGRGSRFTVHLPLGSAHTEAS
jgi:signal transduction histidine kinase